MPQTQVRLFRDTDGSVPVLEWLDELEEDSPKAYVKCLERILQLEAQGYELRRPVADILRDGIYELRTRVGTVNYRILYFYAGANIACLSHGFTKLDKVPAREIDAAVHRASLVLLDPVKYTAEWEV